MTPEFLEYFEKNFNKPYYSDEEKEELKINGWLFWRDSRRELDKSKSSEA